MWISQGENVFLYTSYYLGQHYLNYIDIGQSYLGMKVIAWYIKPNGIKKIELPSIFNTILVLKM